MAAALANHGRLMTTLGAAPGDRVAVHAQPHLETMVALLGNALAGLVTVPLNPRLGRRELDHVLGDSAPQFALAADPDVASIPGCPVHGIRIDTTVGDALPGRVVNDDPLLVLYTSGTTGHPKGVPLSARNVAASLDGLGAAWAQSERDHLVHALPLFHVHGLVLGLFGAMRLGAPTTWIPHFSPERLATCLDERSVLYSVPTMVRRLLIRSSEDGDTRRRLSRSRLWVSGSAGLPMREHARAMEIVGRPIIERYGLTETLINTAVRSDEPRPGFVGTPLHGVELRLLDDVGGIIEASDDAIIGEIAVRGANVFAGYLGRPEATAQVVDQEGFFRTGDLATRAAEGAIRIVGRRATDLIKTGGFKVGAGEVEAALLEHPNVAEVAVVGLPDEDLGERIVAHVVLVDPSSDGTNAAALTNWVAERLSPHKRPRQVILRGDLPRNAMGKVQKRSLLAESQAAERAATHSPLDEPGPSTLASSGDQE